MALQLPPHSEEAEKAILGSIMIDNKSLVKVADFLKADDFYHDKHTIVFEACLELFNEHTPIDITTLNAKLSDKKVLEKLGGMTFLASLAEEVPTASHIYQYGTIVKTKSTLRRLISAGDEIKGYGYEEDEELDGLLDKSEQALFAVTQQMIKQSLVHIKDILSSRYEEFAEVHEKGDEHIFEGVMTGFRDLDKIMNGFKPSEMIVIAGRPAMGKTAFCLSMAQNASLKFGKTIAIFSLEMSKEQLVDRMFSSLLMVDSWKLKKGKLDDADFARIGTVMDQMSKANIFIDDSLGNSITELRSKVRRLKMERGLDMIIIDYLQLMSLGGNTQNRVQEISEISRNLKQIARELHVPVIALSQLSRAVESRPDKRPVLSDLRESGAIEQDADAVLMLYRDDYYDPDSDRKGLADILIRKHRNGPVGTVELVFKPEHTRFYDIDRTHQGLAMEYQSPTNSPVQIPNVASGQSTPF
ncbi:MAG: replicative DNA helicase [Candidatus Gracilibacteria bacterium]|nr:replicative DNA helicase [Candidatus Gracilibacteria bacterium]